MRTRIVRVSMLGAAVIAFALVSPTGARAASISFSLAQVGAYGGEPSITSDNNGVLYDSTPSGLPASAGSLAGSPPIYRSTDQGTSWSMIQPADNNSGDTCLARDQSNALYWCNLASMTASTLPLQADSWKSTSAATCGLTNCDWVHGAGPAPAVTCGTSCQPFGVDRQWEDAAILPPNTTTDKAEVVLMYHDFYGPSQIWVNISQDGGKTFGTSTNVLANAAVPGAVVAEGYTMCNTVPAGVGIVRPGLPHAGRIYVSWIAADLAQNATGCNITMLQSFHTAWVAYSDDQGAHWTAQQAIDMGIGHDMSTPFIAFTLDDQGNPYLAFTSPEQGENPATCGAESVAGTVQSDASCDYHTFVVWSNDGGNTWDGGGGLISGSAAAPYEVDPGSTTAGTDVYPTIAVGHPGQVDVGWLHTSEIVPTNVNGKFLPGGCAGPGTAPNPPTYPAECDWYLHAGQSLNLTAATSAATWTSTQVTPHPMHFGDICNLGIFCVDPASNRNLLDFNQETIDPTNGCAHIAYSDDNAGALADPKNPSPLGNHLAVANQTSGCLGPLAISTVAATTPTPPVPAAGAGTPLGLVVVAAPVAGPAGAAAALLGWSVRRRRRTRRH